jgi:hypothetical protein
LLRFFPTLSSRPERPTFSSVRAARTSAAQWRDRGKTKRPTSLDGTSRNSCHQVPELPGCAADGKTYKEALANVEIIIQPWLETAKQLGRPIPAPRGRLAFA